MCFFIKNTNGLKKGIAFFDCKELTGIFIAKVINIACDQHVIKDYFAVTMPFIPRLIVKDQLLFDFIIEPAKKQVLHSFRKGLGI